MKLIADSGSTECDWTLTSKGAVTFTTTSGGINPFYQEEKDILDIISVLFAEIPSGIQIESIHFYGAGCAFAEKKKIIETVIKSHLPDCIIEIESDLLGAARALCCREKGIACILGTGSNSCFYNGKSIEKNVSPLGFILGDEGSGAVTGRKFIGNLLKNQYPPSIAELFYETYRLTAEEIMEKVYRKPFPNRFLAQFTKFIAQHIDEPCLAALMYECLSEFVSKNIIQYDYKSYPVYFTGSIAFHFGDILREACISAGFLPAEITLSPMEGLVSFHA